LQAAKVIYGGFENWEVRGIRNLRRGVPVGGLTVEVVTVSDGGEILRLEGVWDGKIWTDTLVEEGREDAAKKGGKGTRKGRTEKPKCTKGRPCGMTCIRKVKANGEPTSCKFDPPPVVAQALNTASSIGASIGGGGAGGGQGYPASLPTDHVVTTSKRITAARLDDALDAIDSPGARDRVGMFRAFVEKSGVQAVFVKTDGDMGAHVEMARQTLNNQDWVSTPRRLAEGVSPKAGANGYTNTGFDHVVVHTDDDPDKTRASVFDVGGKRLNDAVSRVLSGADDANDIPMEWGISSATRGWDNIEFNVYLHEMGHQVHYKAGIPSPPMDIKGSVTDFGAKNELEWFAEHFNLWMLDANAYEKVDPVGARFIRDTLEQATAAADILKPEFF
jgi:hypothetical protein